MKACVLCKVVGILAIVGALNWGSIALFQVNFVENLIGQYPMALRVVYGLVGLSGLALLASFFMVCPTCKK
ncbi:MAG: hypothetical protein A3C47_06610 [Omnitrophica bacterium RIFCSPHIGHO2_02_FULL_51_18]|nr:MAG: hypothetical protein A3C47_06610 [Omnitrophica bacterium RIFCSPHIGHO2_02_FULL_51_18]